MNNYQPIEIADKTKAIILHLRRDGKSLYTHIGKWSKPLFGKEGWFCTRNHKRLPDPTHWCYLPDDPKD